MSVSSTLLRGPSFDREPVSSDRKVVFRHPPLWKRAIDVSLSLIFLILLLPLLMLVSIYIKCVSAGPVIFRQQRVGGGAKPFVIYKFRTMTVSNEGEKHGDYVASLIDSPEPAKKPSYKARLIPGGELLRRLSIDELPQLCNVLLGSMSLIGPRPDVLKLEQYEDWQLRRFEVLPGISGLWQVSGKNRLSFNEMIRLDIQYIDSLSFKNDLWILWKTIGHVLSFDNE